MKKQQIIKNVNSILQDTTGIFISNSEGLCDINNKIIQKGDYFNTSNNYIYGYDKEITIVKIENVLKKISTGYTSGCKIFSNNDIICYKLILKENSVEYLLINDDGTTIFRVTGRNIPIHKENDKIVFTDKKQQIFLYNITNGSILWSYTLPEGFKIFGAPEIIDNVVYILAYTSHFQESHRIGLEIETGNKIWEISGGVDKNTTPIHAKTFNPKDKLLYGLYKTFQVFNPKTGELLVNKIIEKANEDHFDAYSKAIYDDKLWFVSGKYENCKFGYINLITNEIELLQDFPQENDEQFSKPIFHEGKLYLKGVYYNNLYIFE